ncbi:MAG TPA: hypothetical protein VH595_17925 [Verrucomicrobiae bacterium]|nr:hypothetical protein [Verrucomicrobiae bacterium]
MLLFRQGRPEAGGASRRSALGPSDADTVTEHDPAKAKPDGSLVAFVRSAAPQVGFSSAARL